MPVHERDCQWYDVTNLPTLDPAVYPNGVFVVSYDWMIWATDEGFISKLVPPENRK